MAYITIIVTEVVISLVVPNTADVLMLQYILNAIAQDGNAAPAGGERVLRLYTNNVSPAKTTEIEDLTEATQAGYTAITLTGTNWTFASSSEGSNSAVYSEQTFNFTTAVTAYGYYVTTSEVTPQILFVERFTDGAYVLTSGGGQITVSPILTAN